MYSVDSVVGSQGEVKVAPGAANELRLWSRGKQNFQEAGSE